MTSFSARIAQAAKQKKSMIILAVDPKPGTKNPKMFAKKAIAATAGNICAVKFNFHLLLPLAFRDVWDVTKLAHSHGLLCIADIKLNDIEDTNHAALAHLAAMGFDGVIANPFMGTATLKSLAKEAKGLGIGVIALVYMSHPDAGESYGLKAEKGMVYEIFLERAAQARADGIIVGATQHEIIRKVKGRMAVYSPGVGAQGGDVEKAVRSGSDYLIVGRSIIESEDQAGAARDFMLRANSARP
jgi:orotidine-5'-phosphate decarboxylase